jgi:hypothetical protein
LSLPDITNVYFVPALGATGNATIVFTSIDSFSGIPNSPATITIPVTNAPSSSSGNTTILGQKNAQNPSPNAVIAEKTSTATPDNTVVDQKSSQTPISTPQKGAVLGELENTTKTENQLVRTGFEQNNSIFKILMVLSIVVLMTSVWLSLKKV